MALAAERFQPQAAVYAALPATPPRPTKAWPRPDKDYSIPLHVDCSVEYELPECAKPPQGVKVEPLLMIHPAHFRRLDSLRRCPFVNNLPAASAFELPPPPPPAVAPRGRRPNWPPAACCRTLGSCALPTVAPQFAPKEGDTLENSSFGKCAPRQRSHPRHRTHPYAPETGLSVDVQNSNVQNCDKTFDALQGNPLVSPYRAKTFAQDAVYQNYPIVMYK